MNIGDNVSFLYAGETGRGLFFWSAKEIPSLKEKVSPDGGLSQFYDSLLPALVFIRWSCGSSSYQNPTPTAHIIIDDPLLRERYGFLDYKRLVCSMENLDYGLTIAFIPWNYRRTKKTMAEFLLACSHKLSLCIHGCDHTDNEFGTANQCLLEQKAALAVERMVQHQQRTKLPFGKVMVFPQGYFSMAAIAALRRNRYLAAVNTTKFPTDGNEEPLTIADELLPAVNRFSGFPVLHRRYPKDRAHFAVDIFLGKPAYVVEHHNVFEHGCEAIETCVRALKKMEPGLCWPGLSFAAERLHLRKECSDGCLHVRFFASSFIFQNPTNRTVQCRFCKPESDPSMVKGVRLNGRNLEFLAVGQFIEFHSEIQPGERFHIQVEDCDEPPPRVFRPGVGYGIKAGVRRHLSEVRDNYLVRHPRLLKPAKLMVRLVKHHE